MPPSEQGFLDLLISLSEQNARFVVVGGVALTLQGSDYVTEDLDFAISRDPLENQGVVRALALFRPYPPQYGSPMYFVWDERSLVGAVASLRSDAGDIDILMEIPGIESFEALYARSEVRVIAGHEVRVASIDDLIAMKQAANRPKDVAHIAQLETLKRLRDEI